MLKLYLFHILLLLGLLSSTGMCYSQITKDQLKLGFSYGKGSHKAYLIEASNYTHDISFYKAILNYIFSDKKKWAFELNLEPGFNDVKHNSLSLGKSAIKLREYVLNLNIIARYKVYKGLSFFAVGGVSPMIGDTETLRLARGFTFSDVLGVGISYQIHKMVLDFRYSQRHTSNLGFSKPNLGHNTGNVEFAILFNL